VELRIAQSVGMDFARCAESEGAMFANFVAICRGLPEHQKWLTEVRRLSPYHLAGCNRGYISNVYGVKCSFFFFSSWPIGNTPRLY
jgi:hypothetical protein